MNIIKIWYLTIIIPFFSGASIAENSIKLGDWQCIGPFKDEEFGNVQRTLDYQFGPEKGWVVKVDKSANLALKAKASSPDEMPLQGRKVEEVNDGNTGTFWDDQDGGKLYAIQLDWKMPVKLNQLTISGWKHNDFAPKTFDVIADGKVIKSVKDAQYCSNMLVLGLPQTKCSSLKLEITASYGGSPAIRELAVYNEKTVADDKVADRNTAPRLSAEYKMKPFPGYLELDRRWEKRADWTDGFYNLLPRGPAPSRNEAVYLYRTITADEDCQVTIHLRMQDFYRVWLNRMPVWEYTTLNSGSRYQRPNSITISLKKGVNHLLLKNVSRWAEHGFSFALEGMHAVKDLHYVETKALDLTRAEDAEKYVRGFKFKPQPIPMYSPAKMPIDEHLGKFTATPAAKHYDRKLAALSKTTSELLAGEVSADGYIAMAAKLESALKDEVKALPPLIFLRQPNFRHNAIGPYTAGGTTPSDICLFDPANPDQGVKTIFARQGMRIFDMSLSWDAKTVFFSAKADGKSPWNIYEVGVDGKGFKAITMDKDAQNIYPQELPGGDIAFVSTRQKSYVQCQGKESGLLYRMNRDGSGIRLLSANIDSDHHPRVMNDGRIMFTRWDYGIEKNVFARHGLWSVNPDGTGLMLVFGNTIEDPGGLWDAYSVPDRPEIFCILGPHHNHHGGMLGLIWNGRGVETPRGEGYRWITREYPVVGDMTYVDGYQTPFPLSERQMLASYGGIKYRKSNPDGEGSKVRLMLIDVYGNEIEIYEDPKYSSLQPIALRARKAPPVIPDKVPPCYWKYEDQEEMNRRNAGLELTSNLLVQDVYKGISKHVKRGEVKYIAVMEQVLKSRRMAAGEAWGHTPIIGRGTVHARRFLGLVPVEQDGSAYFTVPALRSISLNLTDAAGRTVMRMGSDMHTMPQENISCVGCHEVREAKAGSAPLPSRKIPMASKKPPVTPELPGWGTQGLIDYIQVVQPVWDKHCVSCHSGAKPKGNVNMTSDRTRFFCQSYEHLVERDIVDHLSVFSLDHDEGTPKTVGAYVSTIDKHMDEKHCESKISWAERLRVYLWIDANVPYYGTYDYTMMKDGSYRGIGARDAWEMHKYPDGGPDPKVKWATVELKESFQKRCYDCHERTVLNQSWLIPCEMPVTSKIWGDKALTSHGFWRKWKLVNILGPELRVNLTNPSHSSMLQAPLAEDAGGLGMCQLDGKPVFKDKNDPDYQVMLKAIQSGSKNLKENPRIDMLGLEALVDQPNKCKYIPPAAQE